MKDDIADTEGVPHWFSTALAQEPHVGAVFVDDVPISHRSWGRSRPGFPDVLLVHGGAAHARWWDHLAPLLAVDRRVVALDLSGHGDSGPRADYSLHLWADELRATIQASGLSDGPVIVGHSLGGIVTAVLARDGEPRLTGAIIVDSPIEPVGSESPPSPPSPFGPARVYASKAEAVTRFRPIPMQPVLRYIADHVAETSVREVEGGWSWKFDPGFADMSDAPPRTLDGLACPVVLIAGEHGMLSAAARRMMDASKEVAVVEVPEAGHAIMLDQPLGLLTALRGVLAGWGSSAATT